MSYVVTSNDASNAFVEYMNPISQKQNDVVGLPYCICFSKYEDPSPPGVIQIDSQTFLIPGGGTKRVFVRGNSIMGTLIVNCAIYHNGDEVVNGASTGYENADCEYELNRD